jgi:predicted Zn-dependent protease
MKINKDGGNNMQENENTNEEYQQYYENNTCQKCKRALIDTSESKYSVLCTECREQQIRYPIPKLFIAIIIGLLVLVGSSFSQFPEIFKLYKAYATAQQNVNKGYVSDTLFSLEDVMKQYPDNTSIAVLAVDISMESGRYDYAGYTIDNYLVHKKLDKSTYSKITNYTKRIDQFYNTSDSYHKIINGLDKNMNNNQTGEYIKKQLKALLNSPDQDKALINYYLSNIASNTAEAKQYIKKSIEEDDKFLEAHIELANILRRENDFDSAREIYNKLLNKEKDCVGAIRGLAIIEMLSGNKEEAVLLAKKAYDTNKNEVYVVETLMIALIEDGQLEEANKIKEDYIALGNKFDTDTLDYLEGKITINNYYVNNREENK